MYPLLVIAVAIFAVVRGYRRGLTGQVTSVLGLAFGVVCAHIFIPGLQDTMQTIVGAKHYALGGDFLTTNLAGGVIYIGIYLLFRLITKILRNLSFLKSSDLLNSIIGVVFCLCNYLLMLSICLNIIVGWDPESSLMHDGKADDGNIVGLVMQIAPPVLGSDSFDDFAYQVQLRDAKKIS